MTGALQLVDSHAHLTSAKLVGHADELVQRAQAAGVGTIINICTDAPSLDAGLALHNRHPNVFNAGATTPHDVDKEGDALFPRFAQAARDGLLIAIGETGLDYFYHHSQPETQKRFLIRYLLLATECQLPVIIHCRDAFADFFAILDDHYRHNDSWGPGVLHCFTGTVDEARQVLDRGWYLSLSGIVTYKNSQALREVAKLVPLDQLLIETDSPYLAPQSQRGKTNEPSFLPDVAHTIAAVQQVPVEQVAAATVRNARRLFRL